MTLLAGRATALRYCGPLVTIPRLLVLACLTSQQKSEHPHHRAAVALPPRRAPDGRQAQLLPCGDALLSWIRRAPSPRSGARAAV